MHNENWLLQAFQHLPEGPQMWLALLCCFWTSLMHGSCFSLLCSNRWLLCKALDRSQFYFLDCKLFASNTNVLAFCELQQILSKLVSIYWLSNMCQKQEVEKFFLCNVKCSMESSNNNHLITICALKSFIYAFPSWKLNLKQLKSLQNWFLDVLMLPNARQ